MITLARQIRGAIDHLPGAHRPQTPAQQDRQAFILQAGRIVFTRFGFESITMRQFSLGLQFTPDQIRWHYPDLESLLGAIFRDHLRTIGEAINDAVRDSHDPEVHQLARAAYFAAMRDAAGAFTEAHRFYLHERHLLPEDEARSVAIYTEMLGRALGGDYLGAEALALLNRDAVTLAEVEDTMAGLAAAAPGPVPSPRTAQPADIIPAGQAGPPGAPPHLPRHIRRKIEAIRRQRLRHETK
jgi:AcrR family transcriptional regulator